VGFAFFQELLSKTKPRSPGIDAVTLVNDVQEVGGDGVEELGDCSCKPCFPGTCSVFKFLVNLCH
jgi:hypothetical protein